MTEALPPGLALAGGPPYGPVEHLPTAAGEMVAVRPERGPHDFDAYVRSQRGALLRYAFLLCGSQAQAEDIVQEVLARVYLRWDTLNPDAGRRTYLRRSLMNEFLSWRRRWSTRMLAFVETTDLHDIVDHQQLSKRDEQMWSCLSKLPNRQRAAVVLRYYEGLADTEIAEILGSQPSTVRANISRALATLRQQPEIRTARENLS